MTKISYRMRPNPCLRSKTALQPSIRQLARTSSQMWYLSSTQSRVSVRYWREYLSSNSTKKTRVSLTFHTVYSTRDLVGIKSWSRGVTSWHSTPIILFCQVAKTPQKKSQASFKASNIQSIHSRRISTWHPPRYFYLTASKEMMTSIITRTQSTPYCKRCQCLNTNQWV